MCFSPQADFTAGAIVSVVGVQTLRRVRVPGEVIIGSLPILLGAHQFVEGFVWLGLRGQVSSAVADTARDAYIVFAHAVLPVIVPLGFALMEPSRRRARWVWLLASLGLLLGSYLLWQVTAYPIGAQQQAHCIDYTTHTPNDYLIGALYVLVTCGPALLSSRPYIRWFGLLSLLGVIAVAIVRVDELTSVWCLYVAFVSVLILEHFRRQRASDTRATIFAVPVRRE
jgi:Family of unknown function (DUF6629)